MPKKLALQYELLGFSIYRLYSQASNLLRRTFQAEGFDLTPEQWGVLTRLREEEGMNQSHLGEKTFKDRHNITRILNVLERQGCIERRADTADKRVYRLFLTPSGLALQNKLDRLVKAHREAVFKGLNPTERESLQRIISRIIGNIEKRYEAIDKVKEDREWRGKTS
jgi:DNA-binding MarR family transcriptional regulator